MTLDVTDLRKTYPTGDEPTSSLDPETSNTVMRLLTEIAAERGIPVLINIHEVDLATEYVDRIVGLYDGEIVFDGPPENLQDEALDRVYRGGERPSTDRSDAAQSTDSTDPADSTPIDPTPADDSVPADSVVSTDGQTPERSASGGS